MVQFSREELESIIQNAEPYRGVKGSIVRLKVHDFMTYHKVELRAGPNVNLILGPNGTGKSTIVCAICIGLAGKPKILGRALSLKEYIRHDCTTASTEVELYNPDGDNFVVKRFIRATQTSANSTWTLNGKKVSQSQVEQLLTKLNIQLDNLCQFLPQDRVQEFSKMDSQALLKSTQLAMGKDTLIQRHDHLIQLNEFVRQTECLVSTSSETLRAETQHNQRLENEVKNYHEREMFKNKISNLKGKKAWIVYQKAINNFSKVNSELQALQAKKKEEEGKLQPMKKSIHQMETKVNNYNREMGTCRNPGMLKAIKTKFEDECDKIEVRVNEITSEFEAMEKQDKDRQKHVEAATQKLNALMSELEKFNSEGYNSDLPRLEQDMRRINEEVTKLSEQIFKLAEEQTTDELEIRGLNERISRMRRDIDRLCQLRTSRLKFMERERRDAYEAVAFFEKPENLKAFKGEIHEPMLLHIEVNDLKYGPVVERHIGISDMTAFFCEEKDDLEKMLAMLKPRGIRISIIHHEKPLPTWKKPLSCLKPEYRRQFGFDRTLVDLISAPDYYMSYMIKKHRLQDIPVGKSPDTDKKFKEIKAQTNFGAFYTDENSYFIKKSNYGTGSCSSVDFLPSARVFTTTINAAERERLEGIVRDSTKLKESTEKRLKGRRSEISALEECRRIKEEEYNAIRKKIEYKRQTTNKIAQAKRVKDQLEKDVPDLEALKEKSQKDIWDEREKLTLHLKWCVDKIDDNAKSGALYNLLKRQNNVMQTRILTKQNLLEDLQASINQHNGEIKSLTEQVNFRAQEAEKAKKDAIDISGKHEPPKDVAEGKVAVEEINREITQAESQMGFLVDTDASIVKDYQERLKKIEKLNHEKGYSLAKLQDLKKEITRKKTEWLDPLKELIQRINKNFGTFFQNMGCVGEVSLCHSDDEDDFAKYGIKIMVSFRSSEPLAEMCGTRVGTLQSGGERVITTALYVLALQELTVVPFRVIDEINQGMDAKNESRFFNLLCSLANGANTPQYFLLTPKMLPPVDYPDNVDFHLIMNGPKVNVPLLSGSEDSSDDDHNAGGDQESDSESD